MASKPRGEAFEFALTFEAQIVNAETDEELHDPAVLARLDGIREAHDLAANVSDTDLTTGIRIRSAIPILRFDRAASRLLLVIPFSTDRDPTERDKEQIAAFSRKQIWGGWGMNHEFDLPLALDGFVVHFESEPRERIATPSADAMAKLAEEWSGWDYERLESLSSDELDAVLRRLEPHAVRDYTAGGASRMISDLYEAARAQRQRRAVARSGIPQVSIDDLDKLDDLPADTF